MISARADTTSPYSISWDTTTTSNGSHTLTAVATDTTNQTTTSDRRTVTVTNTGPGQPGLVLAFGFSQTGSTVVDQSGRGNNGVVSGATSVTAGHTGRGRRFDGTNDLVRVTDSASLDLTGSLTIEAWVLPTALGAKARPVVVKQVSGSAIAYGLYAHRASPRRPAGIVTTNGTARTADGTAVLTSSVWTHLAFTYDGTNLRLYVNGALVRTVAATGAIAVTTGDLLIGSDSAGWFKGTLDDLRIYDRALSATEDRHRPRDPGSLAAPGVVAPCAPDLGSRSAFDCTHHERTSAHPSAVTHWGRPVTAPRVTTWGLRALRMRRCWPEGFERCIPEWERAFEIRAAPRVGQRMSPRDSGRSPRRCSRRRDGDGGPVGTAVARPAGAGGDRAGLAARAAPGPQPPL